MPESRDKEPGGESRGAAPAYRSARAVTLFVTLFAALLACDLGFKSWSFTHVPDHGIELIPKVLALRLTQNHGAVFGMMQGQKVFFIFASVAALGFIGYFFGHSKPREWPLHAALAAILAGAMGNLHDRIAYGAVRDMLNLFPDVKLPFALRWPGGMDEIYPWIFNPADVFLLLGMGVIILRSLLRERGKKEPAA